MVDAAIPMMMTDNRLVIVANTKVTSGAATRAMATFDSTVSWSDTGSDFQNRTLRSLRSSNNALRQKKKTTKPSTMNSGAPVPM